MGKLTIIMLLFYNFAFANTSDYNFYFQNDLTEIEKAIASNVLKDKNLFSVLSPEKKFLTVSQDPDNKIHADFKMRPYFFEATQFWFNIYTVYSSENAVIHDRERLGIIYTILDYSSLHQSDILNQTKQALQNQITASKIQEVRTALTQLAEGKSINEEIQKMIFSAIDSSPYEIPSSDSDKKSFFLSLAENIRAQTGQKNHIEQGLVNYFPFANIIDSYFQSFGLPLELLALAFLESSFNTRAQSRVGATGVWQFMRRIGGHFMTVNNHQDDRLNPLISTVGALFLLKENHQILNRWDLAIVAYNSGTRHLIKARRELKLENMTLEDYFTRYEHPHIGFASRNFFPSFLALVHALAYKDQFFNVQGLKERAESSHNINTDQLKAYSTKCSFNANWFFNALSDSSPEIRELNRHLLNPNHTYPRGTVVFSDVNLTERRYVEVPIDRIPYNYPKNWHRFVRNQSCSTR